MVTRLSRLGCSICTVVISIYLASAASAGVISSTYDTDSDGWIALNLYADGTLANPAGVSWTASGGNPGGYIWRSDYGPEGYGFSAPAKFLGDKSGYIGGTLSWDMENNVADYLPYNPANHIILTGGGLTITHWGEYPVSSSTWTHVVVSLKASDGWTRVVDENEWRAPLTDEQFASVLANLETLWLNADWGWGQDTSCLDSVVMQIPEPATVAMLSLGGLLLVPRWRAA